MKDIRIVQVGMENWATLCSIPERIEWIYVSPQEIEMFVEQRQTQIKELKKQKLTEPPPKDQLLVLTDASYPASLGALSTLFGPYEVIYDKKWHVIDNVMQKFIHQMMGQAVEMSDVEQTLYRLSKSLFSGQYGNKLHIRDVQLSPFFSGKVTYEGDNYIVLEGLFGEGPGDYQQIAHYRYNIEYYSQVLMAIWPEFIKEQTCDIVYKIQLIQSGSEATVLQTWEIEESELVEQIPIDHDSDGYLHISIYIRGYGKVKIGPCHYRWSRGSLGEFVLGGQRYNDHDRHEFNYYLYPGDFKPPLCVYFSGWRSAEGFEGYGMMKSFGTPFLLFCDPRLIGGAFYLGSQEYEKKISEVIRDSLKYLGFTEDQLILSGLSMGTFGALYYGSEFSPHAVILSKPVLSIGSVAKWERLERAGGFPTSVSLLQYLYGSQDESAIAQLNARFWNKFSQKKFTNTILAVAYMKNDDYDQHAFKDLINHTRDTNVRVVGKGWVGRHTDGAFETISWFISQYKDIIHKFREEKSNEQ